MKRRLICVIITLLICILFSVSARAEYGKWGYVDRSGRLVIDLQYDYCYGFSEGRGCVFNGELDEWGLTEEGLYGYINEEGMLVIPMIYQKASSFEGGYAAVCKDGKYGVIDVNGVTVIDFAYDYISTSVSTNSFIAFNGTLTEYGFPDIGTYYVLNMEGDVVFFGEFEELRGDTWYYKGSKDGKYALLDLNGVQLTEFKYDYLNWNTENKIIFSIGDKYGYMDATGDVLIEAQYEFFCPFVEGVTIVNKDGNYCLINEKGENLITYNADYVSPSIHDRYTCAFKGTVDENRHGYPDEGYYYLMKTDGTCVTKQFIDVYYLEEAEKWRTEVEKENFDVIDSNGKVYFSIEAEKLYDSGKDLYYAEKDGMWAIIDSDGNMLSDFEWTELNMSEDGLCAVRGVGNDFRNVRWGMTMNEVIEAEGYQGKTGITDDGTAYVVYTTTFMEKDVQLMYYFSSEGLSMAIYAWYENGDGDDCIIEYEKIKEQLAEEMGEAISDKENWESSIMESAYANKKGEALIKGYFSRTAVFFGNNTVCEYMAPSEGNVVFGILYM